MNVTRKNKAVDINTPEPSKSLITLTSRQTIITGNKEQPALDAFTTQLWPFNNEGKASALPWQLKFCSHVHPLLSSATENLQPCTPISSDCNNDNGLPLIELKLLPSSTHLNSSHQCRYLPLSIPHFSVRCLIQPTETALKLMGQPVSQLHPLCRWGGKTNRV